MRLNHKSCFPWLLVLAAVSLPVFAAGPSGAASPVVSAPTTASGMLSHIAEQVPMLMRFVTALAYVLGMYFIIFSLLKLREFGEQRTMMSSQHHLREPLTYLAVGVFLLYLPSAVQTSMSTFWSQPNPYGYEEMSSQYASIIGNALLIVQLIGTIAFVRGLIILSHTGSQHGGQGSVAKGMTHIIGGIFCINIYQFTQMVLATLGIQVSLS